MKNFTYGQFNKIVNIILRTIRYYDKYDLLKPKSLS